MNSPSRPLPRPEQKLIIPRPMIKHPLSARRLGFGSINTFEYLHFFMHCTRLATNCGADEGTFIDGPDVAKIAKIWSQERSAPLRICWIIKFAMLKFAICQCRTSGYLVDIDPSMKSNAKLNSDIDRGHPCMTPFIMNKGSVVVSLQV